MVPRLTTEAALKLCRWEQIEGRPIEGRSSPSVVWICEYPYHTLRADGPTDECSGCPVWEALQYAKRPSPRTKDRCPKIFH
jgi:hypothetical protein